MCCCGGEAKWKREVINDHKFDFVDVDEFYEDRLSTKFKYCFVFLFTIKSILIYVLDIYTAVMLVFFNSWTSDIDKDLKKLAYIRWIFVGSIVASYVLLFLDIRKARAVVVSSDISFTFTSIIANRYYTLRSYAHYCFFNQIHNQKRFKDELAFFVFFALKGWKRMLFAEAARRFVNGYTLFFSIKGNYAQLNSWYLNLPIDKKISIVTMGIPCLLFIVSAVRTIFASILYIPLVCEIRGNLKEYCCHKIDKRISELLRTRNRKRILREQLLNGTVRPTKPNIEPFNEEKRVQSHYFDTKEKYMFECRTDTSGHQGLRCGGRKMSQVSLVSESTVVSRTSDRRAQVIAAKREYRMKQQKQHRIPQHSQEPTSPSIEQPYFKASFQRDDQRDIFDNSLYNSPIQSIYNPEPLGSTSRGCILEENSHALHEIPYQPSDLHHRHEAGFPSHNSVNTSLSSPTKFFFGDHELNGNSALALDLGLKPNPPAHSDQMNTLTAQEELPTRYRSHYTIANRDAQFQGKRMKRLAEVRDTTARNAINF